MVRGGNEKLKTGEWTTNDVWTGEHIMEEETDERYLGDVISTNGQNLKNIKARIAKGKGIMNKIFTMLDGFHFGKQYFEVGVLLRNSLLVSSMLFNSEAWYNLTETELNLLETIDLQFLRQLLKAPKGTPKEMFFLELGCMPYREIIRERRLGFLHYILNEDKDSMVNRFFHSQLKTRKKKDWVTTVLEDLKYLGLSDLSIEEIRKMKKVSFMKLVKTSIKSHTFDKLEKTKSSHSKVKILEHKSLKMQKYLQPNQTKITNEEAQLVFKLRCRVTETKVNLKGKYDMLECDACGKEEETQEHILLCTEINKNGKISEYKYKKLYNGTVLEKLTNCKKI